MRTAQLEEEDRYQKALEEYRHGQYKNTDESLDALSAVEQEHKENLARIQDEYLANFNEDTLEQAGGWLQRIIDTKAAGEDLTEEQEELARNLILALDSLPDDMNEKGKEALDALGIGLDDQGNVILQRVNGWVKLFWKARNPQTQKAKTPILMERTALTVLLAVWNPGFRPLSRLATISPSRQWLVSKRHRTAIPQPKKPLSWAKITPKGYALGIEKNAKEAAAAAKDMVTDTIGAISDQSGKYSFLDKFVLSKLDVSGMVQKMKPLSLRNPTECPLPFPRPVITRRFGIQAITAERIPPRPKESMWLKSMWTWRAVRLPEPPPRLWENSLHGRDNIVH